jgi:hypothetical protein
VGIPGRKRFHTEDSIQIKYYDKPKRLFDKAAMTVTIDGGCEFGVNSGVSFIGGTLAKPSQYFPGSMTYQHCWFLKDLFAITLGGGAINNPGRYLVLLPPINGATAITGSLYFTEIRVIRIRLGMPPRPWITCRGSSSPGDSNTTTGHPMCPISPAMVGSLLSAETPAIQP